MALLPRISATHTDFWVSFWNNTFLPALEGEISGGGGGWPGALTHDGRILTTGATDGAAETTPTPALAIVIPDGAAYVVGGVLKVADEDKTIGGLSPNFTGWLELVVTYNSVSETDDWTVIEHVTRPALGTGILGKVTTGASSVTSLDTSEAESDVILSAPLIASRLRSIEARLALLEGGGGGGGGGAAYASFLPWQPSPGDTRDTVTVVNALLAALEAELRTEIQNGGVMPFPTPFDILANSIAKCAIADGESSPHSIERQEMALIKPGSFGDGSNDTPAHDLGGTLTPNTTNGTYEP